MTNQTITKGREEKVACAAVKDLDGKVWLGKRHSDCYFLMSRFNAANEKIEGFVDVSGNFLNRNEALERAIKTGQVIKGKTLNVHQLFSEDLYTNHHD